MAMTVTMPQLGETVTEGTILRWAKQAGDTVSEDEVLLEISTDKVDTEVPSPAAGTVLEILVQEGETVAVGTPLVVIGDPGESTDDAETVEPAAEEASADEPTVEEASADESSDDEPDGDEPDDDEQEAEASSAEAPPAPVRSEAGNGNGPPLSPVVRRLAAEHDVDLGRVSGSGRGGRITRRDVEAFIEAGPEKEPAVAAVAPQPEPEKATPVSERATPPPAPVSPRAGDETVELDRLRVRIAENMVRAKQSTAHVWTSVEVDYEAVEQVRRRHREAFKEREGFSLTYLPFITRATVDALEAFPVVNSSFDLEGRKRTIHNRIDLGFSVDLDQEGLVVMTVRGADGLRLRGIAREVRRVADKARSGEMEPDDVAGSTFTLTNPGPFGSFMSAPIINVPNVAILSTDTVAKRPVVVQDRDGSDAIAIHHVGYLGLTWDHRAFDGSTAVLFLRRIKDNLENWDWEQELT